MSAQQVEGAVLVAIGQGLQAESAAIEAILGPLTVTAVDDLETYADGISEKVNPAVGLVVKGLVAQYGPEVVTAAEGAENFGLTELGTFFVTKGESLEGALPAESTPPPAEEHPAT